MLKFSLLGGFPDRLHCSLYPSVFVCFYSYSLLFFEFSVIIFLMGELCVCAYACANTQVKSASFLFAGLVFLDLFPQHNSEKCEKQFSGFYPLLSITESYLNWDGSIQITDSDPFF